MSNMSIYVLPTLLVINLILGPILVAALKSEEAADALDQITTFIDEHKGKETRLSTARIIGLVYGMNTKNYLESLAQHLRDGSATKDQVLEAAEKIDVLVSHIEGVEKMETDLMDLAKILFERTSKANTFLRELAGSS